jgi:hypothetical protein
MLEQENMNGVPQGGSSMPPTPPAPPVAPASSIPTAPSIPPAHQMMGMGSMASTTATTTAAAAGASSFWSTFLAIFILILGGGSIYFAVTKNAPTSGTPVTEIPGFDLSNNQTQNENNGIAVGEPNPNGSSVDTGTTPTDGSQIPSVPTDTNSTLPASTSTTSGTHAFKCEDVLSAADYQKLTKDGSPVKITPDELAGIYYKCNYEQNKNDEWQTPLHSLGLSFEFSVKQYTRSQMYDKTVETATGSYAQQISPNSTPTTENITGVGAKAFLPSLFKGSLMWVLSTNQKYLFSVQIYPDKDNVFIKDIGKAVDANLNKY